MRIATLLMVASLALVGAAAFAPTASAACFVADRGEVGHTYCEGAYLINRTTCFGIGLNCHNTGDDLESDA